MEDLQEDRRHRLAVGIINNHVAKLDRLKNSIGGLSIPSSDADNSSELRDVPFDSFTVDQLREVLGMSESPEPR